MIVAAYNQLPHLRLALRGYLRQTVPTFRLTVADDNHFGPPADQLVNAEIVEMPAIRQQVTPSSTVLVVRCLGVEQLDEAYQPTVKAAIVSHLHSGLAPMRSIMSWAADRGVLIVEDACQTPGALVDGRLAGTWGDIGVLSFGGSKPLTAGRGAHGGSRAFDRPGRGPGRQQGLRDRRRLVRSAFRDPREGPARAAVT